MEFVKNVMNAMKQNYAIISEQLKTKTAHLAARTQEYKNVIKSLKAKISRRDTTIKNFEELIEEKDQKHYLVELLSIALEEGKLHETQFFYQLLENTLQNLVSSKNVNGFRYKECIIHWCLLLRFYGGSRLWNILKGNSLGETITSENALDKLNLLLPSISTIKSYLPDLSFGNLVDSDLKDIVKAMALNNISNKIIISYDEIEIRGGLCVMKSTGKVIGFTNCNEKSFEDIYNAKREITPDDIASHVCQFFATTLDGEMSFPICFGGHKSNHYEFITKKMTEIRDQFKRTSYGDYVLEVVGGCSDGLAGNYQYATSHTNENYVHLFDWSHLLKRLRNRLLKGDDLIIEKESFSMNTLLKVRNEPQLRDWVSENIIYPVDIMKMEPVFALIDSNVISGIEQSKQIGCCALAKYLTLMQQIHQIFDDERCSNWNEKKQLIESVLITLKEWKDANPNIISDELYSHIVMTMTSLRSLFEKYGNHIQIKACGISTLIVEHFFSLIRGKIRYPNFRDYCGIYRAVWIALKTKLAKNSPINVNQQSTTKCYGNCNVRLDYSELHRKHYVKKHILQEDDEDTLLEKDQTISEEMYEYVLDVTQDFLPQKNVMLIREYLCKQAPVADDGTIMNNIFLSCPECNQIMVRQRSFIKHLQCHNYSPQQCKDTLYNTIITSLKSRQFGQHVEGIVEEIATKLVTNTFKQIRIRTEPELPKESVITFNSEKGLFVPSNEKQSQAENISTSNIATIDSISEDSTQISKTSPQNKYVFFDFETTGLWKNDDPPKITEYCFVDVLAGAVLYGLVNPGKVISNQAQSITGLNLNILRSKLPIEGHVNDIIQFLNNNSQGKTYLIAHNGDRLDFKVFAKEFFGKFSEFNHDNIVFVDSLRLMKSESTLHNCLPRKMTKKGKSKPVFAEDVLIEHFNLGNVNNSHCAFYDAIGLLNILIKFYGNLDDALKAIECFNTNQLKRKREKINDSNDNEHKAKKKVGCRCKKGNCLNYLPSKHANIAVQFMPQALFITNSMQGLWLESM
ncbi:hypothetical protein C9374_005225 [Naegleria lovaniensis]|uniref:C2H2-type domain-containing protein n=1 Tax=Naegleria lovaniensis TaxID=51637 RepID=A0AA88GLX2_NAELO|nr:uncharacterized protein C9374_005225 [Naegleria lovaniensis]KAG2382645.1 hypothetical protein C9374_005225 [Naegleria lovaniensis]